MSHPMIVVVAFGLFAGLTAACSTSSGGGGVGGTDGGGGGVDAGGTSGGGDAAACGAAQGSATVTGTLDGHTLTAKDAIYAKDINAAVVIGDFAGLCALGGTDLKASSNILALNFTGSIPVGTVTVGTTLEVQYANYDATCQSPVGESASAGSVTITRSDACGVAGTFDLTLNLDHVTGSFDAPNCALEQSDASSQCK